MNARSQVVVIGGGLAGLSAGCYALASGFRVRVLEHNLDLGGVCTAWTRGDYTVDGCIQWLTGGPFERLYRELGILPRVSVIPLDHFATYRDLAAGTEIAVGRDLDGLAAALKRLARGDAAEIDRLVQGAAAFASMQPPADTPAELATLRDSLASLWNLRHQAAGLAHFRKTLGDWAGSLESEELRRFFVRLMPA